nr:hypothetical protein BaRGS_028926 [Batillaria attramentaria]
MVDESIAARKSQKLKQDLSELGTVETKKAKLDLPSSSQSKEERREREKEKEKSRKEKERKEQEKERERQEKERQKELEREKEREKAKAKVQEEASDEDTEEEEDALYGNYQGVPQCQLFRQASDGARKPRRKPVKTCNLKIGHHQALPASVEGRYRQALLQRQ